MKAPLITVLLSEAPAWPLNELQIATRGQLLEALSKDRICLDVLAACPLCGDSESSCISAADRFGLTFSALCCHGCGLVRTDPMLSSKTMSTYYSEFYHPLHFGFGSVDLHGSLTFDAQGSRILDFLRPALSLQLAGRKTLRIAEVGSASGYVLSEIRSALRAQGDDADVVGCEYSEELAAVAIKERAVSTVLGGLEELRKREDRYDVIILSHVVEHFQDPVAAARKLAAMLAPSGIVYVEVPGLLDLRNKVEYGQQFKKYFTHAHCYHFCLSTLRHTMAPDLRLLYGDEFVRSVFVVNDCARAWTNQAEPTLYYLRQLDATPVSELPGRWSARKLAGKAARALYRKVAARLSERKRS